MKRDEITQLGAAFLLGFAVAMLIASATVNTVRKDLQQHAIQLGVAWHNPTNGVFEWNAVTNK